VIRIRLHGAIISQSTMHEFHHSLAIVIGINAYAGGIPPLRSAANDARRLARILTDDHGYDVRLLLDEQATFASIIRLLTETLPAEVGPDDRVLVYFAGHGIALDGEDGPAGYLVPQDARLADRASFLPMHSLHQALIALPCRHLLLILDCCFAGAFRWSSTRSLWAPPGLVYRERYDRFVRDPAWQVISSAAYDERGGRCAGRFWRAWRRWPALAVRPGAVRGLTRRGRSAGARKGRAADWRWCDHRDRAVHVSARPHRNGLWRTAADPWPVGAAQAPQG